MCVVSCLHVGYPYAKCFICKEIGHIARSCPDNPRGLFPNGQFIRKHMYYGGNKAVLFRGSTHSWEIRLCYLEEAHIPMREIKPVLFRGSTHSYEGNKGCVI